MKRFIAIVVGSAIVLLLLAVVFFFGVGYYLSPQSKLVKADAIVAISGGETDARTQTAIQLYQEGYSSHLIFSGAASDPNGPSNAQAMADLAESGGVPPAAIQLDETSVNTGQNATNVAVIVRQSKYQSIILVTSPYHQRRADIAFQHALGSGFPIINHSSFDQAWRRSDWWATSYSRDLTYSELQKVAYQLVSGQDQ
jgi:uncharacterized SAM-binding protein YcdF (DUF218 family)